MADVIASEDIVVEDENLGISRHLFAGQRVPPDLVAAYHAATGGEPKPDEASGGSTPAKPQGEIVTPARLNELERAEDKLERIEELIDGSDVPGLDHDADVLAQIEQLVAAANASATSAHEGSVDWNARDMTELKEEVGRRKLDVHGSGKNGAITKPDLVAALEADDAA